MGKHLEASGDAASVTAAVRGQLAAAAADQDWDTAERALLALRALTAVPAVAKQLHVRLSPSRRAALCAYLALCSRHAITGPARWWKSAGGWLKRLFTAHALDLQLHAAFTACLVAQGEHPESELDALASTLQGSAGLDAVYKQELLTLMGSVREALGQCRAAAVDRTEL